MREVMNNKNDNQMFVKMRTSTRATIYMNRNYVRMFFQMVEIMPCVFFGHKFKNLFDRAF